MINPTYHFNSEVTFAETDASGRVHFSQFFVYIEKAEHAFLKSKGLSVFDRSTGWPRVKVSCEYLSPLRFQDLFTVHLELTKIGSSSLTWYYKILNHREEKIAFGEMITVKVNGEGKVEKISQQEKNLLLAL